LTARDSVRDRVKGPSIGADDYLVKPFASPNCWRVRSVLRRSPGRQDESLRVDDLEIDTRRHKAVRSVSRSILRAKEFLLLAHLVRSAGEVCRAAIVEQVWDIDFHTDTMWSSHGAAPARQVDDPFETK